MQVCRLKECDCAGRVIFLQAYKVWLSECGSGSAVAHLIEGCAERLHVGLQSMAACRVRVWWLSAGLKSEC